MFKSIEELRAYREECKKLLNSESKKIIVCGGAGCVSKGANKVYEKLVEVMKEKNVNTRVKPTYTSQAMHIARSISVILPL